ncbi:MAG: glycosyltransferase family 4 protein, partial [Planctomycetota bacterium]
MAIRVLHLIGNLRLGGAQVCLKQIVENASEDVEHFVYPLRCKQIDISIEGKVLLNPYRKYDPRKFFDILRVCKEYNIDIIHAHLHKPILGALLTTYFQKIPVIVHEHGSIARPGIQYTFYRLMLRLLKKRASLFIAVSNAAAKQLASNANIKPERIKVVYNAVDLEKFAPKPEIRQSIRNELNIAPEDIVIGFVGRLSHVKGPDILLNAFSLLIRKNPNYMLVFLGSGDMEKQLRSKANNSGTGNRVKFLGFRENAAEIMNAFDIAAITSRQDAFPLTPLEIMSMKIPLVSCNVYGLAEIVTHGQNALVPQENAPPKIADCIEKLICDEALRQSLVENGLASVQQFDVSNLVTQTSQIYRNL